MGDDGPQNTRTLRLCGTCTRDGEVPTRATFTIDSNNGIIQVQKTDGTYQDFSEAMVEEKESADRVRLLLALLDTLSDSPDKSTSSDHPPHKPARQLILEELRATILAMQKDIRLLEQCLLTTTTGPLEVKDIMLSKPNRGKKRDKRTFEDTGA